MSDTKQLTMHFMRLCSERHVPSRLSTQWMAEYALHTPHSDREAYNGRVLHKQRRSP